jgi:2-keto-3-deoxy-L-rhamnonate aldolase RhmA
MLDNVADNIQCALEETFVMLQIEDREALDCIDDIAAVPGVDAFFVGPGDLSASLGVQGGSPELDEAIKVVAAAAKRHGKWWGLPVGNTQAGQKYLDMGAQFLNYSSDLGAIVREFKRSYAEFSQLKPNK